MYLYVCVLMFTCRNLLFFYGFVAYFLIRLYFFLSFWRRFYKTWLQDMSEVTQVLKVKLWKLNESQVLFTQPI